MHSIPFFSTIIPKESLNHITSFSMKTCSFLLCPLTFFSARITTILFLYFGLLGWGHCHSFPKISYKKILFLVFLLLFILQSPASFMRIIPYCCVGLGVLYLPRSLCSSSLLALGIAFTCCCLLTDIYGIISFSRHSGKLHSVPCIAIAMSVWIPLYSFWKTKKIFKLLCLYLITAFTLKKCQCDAAFLAFVIATCIVPLTSFPRCFKALSFSYLLFFFLPWIYWLQPSDIETLNKRHPVIDFSYVHRLYILSETCQTIRQGSWKHFLVGRGVNASRSTLAREPLWIFFERNIHKTVPIPAGYFHPHNLPLQVWYDLGFFGVVLFGWMFCSLAFTCAPQMLWFSISAIISLISVGLWEWWWIGLMGIMWMFNSSPLWSQKKHF